MSKKSFTIVIIALVFFGVVILVWNKRITQDVSESQTQVEIDDGFNSKKIYSETDSWEVLKNEKYKYSVRFPKDVLAENISEDGYIIDFRFLPKTIRVESSVNHRKDKTLRELIELRNHVGVSIINGDHEYLEKIINGKQAFQYRYVFLDEKYDRNPANDEYLISVNTVILGKDYYYQIQTLLPVNDKQYSETEKMYDMFLNAFTLDSAQ